MWVKNLGNTSDDAEPPPQQDAASVGCENKSAAPRTRPRSTCFTQVEERNEFTFNYRLTLRCYGENHVPVRRVRVRVTIGCKSILGLQYTVNCKSGVDLAA